MHVTYRIHSTRRALVSSPQPRHGLSGRQVDLGLSHPEKDHAHVGGPRDLRLCVVHDAKLAGERRELPLAPVLDHHLLLVKKKKKKAMGRRDGLSYDSRDSLAILASHADNAA